MPDETVRVVLATPQAHQRAAQSGGVKVEFPDESTAVVRARGVAPSRLLALDVDTSRLGRKEIRIEADDPVVAAVLAWVLKPWLRPGRWRVNGISITR